MKTYLVGGTVRDMLIGIKSKDIDYAVEASSFEEMREELLQSGHKIYLEKPEFGSIRAQRKDGAPVDYTLCRTDGIYSDHRRPDSIEIGTIETDLARRDFTCNAIAIREDGTFFDPYDGIKHIGEKKLVAVGNTKERLEEDYLRILRAFRFHITKDFNLSYELEIYLCRPDVVDNLRTLSIDRIREELKKCFTYNTSKTLLRFHQLFPKSVIEYLFSDETGIWLNPTTKEKS